MSGSGTRPKQSRNGTGDPVVFIHSLWLHATSWAPWQDFFGAAGYDTMAPGWPGDQDTVELARANPDTVANNGIDDVTDHYAAIIESLPAPPILIGHSFGGMIAEKLLGMNKGAAAIGIDAAQIKGVLRLPLSALHATLPVFKNPANKHKVGVPYGRAVPLQLRQRYLRGGIQPALPEMGCPLSRAAALRGRGSQFSPHSPDKVDADNPDRGRFCSPWAARTTPSPNPSPNRHSSNTGTPRRSPTWSSSKTGATP